ncbi:MAG: dihydrolipoyllysine-residue succinyltransferase, partial [Methylacidiphilaceae bacterium]|nr:dihydrolipoyllysine-residue succinyltransferase [Candidatus Methylacidiphilaceae bacterium]
MPFLGESIQGGILGKWLKAKGDRVEPGDALGEIETEKITSEIYAEVAGSFIPLVDPGTQVEVGQVVARIEEGQEAQRAISPPAAPAGQPQPMSAEARPAPAEPASPTEAGREEEKLRPLPSGPSRSI